MTGIVMERTIEQAVEEDVRLERSIDAKSARIEWGFWEELRSVLRGTGWTYNDIGDDKLQKSCI